MNFLRLPAVAMVLAAAVCSFSQSSTAQSFNDGPITIESDWAGGYMGLGGGLVKSIVTVANDRPTTARHRARHVHVMRASHAAVASKPEVTPIAFIARTLDHTGYNISSLGEHAGAR